MGIVDISKTVRHTTEVTTNMTNRNLHTFDWHQGR